MSYFGTLIWTVGGAKRLFSPKKRRNALKLGRFLRDHLGIDMARLLLPSHTRTGRARGPA